MPSNNSYRAVFNEQTVINRGITDAYLQEGSLYVVFSNGVTESLGPVSSYAYAVANNLAGEGTNFPTFESWAEHVAGVTDLVATAEAWTNGTIGGTPVETVELPSSYETAVSQGLAGENTDYDTEAKWNAHVAGTPTQHHNSKYYATQAQTSATNLAAAVSSASDSAEAAQAWAVGSTEPSSQPSSENNAHYWATQAATSAGSADDYAETARASEQNAECWAVGTKSNQAIEADSEHPEHPSEENNARYYALRCEGYVNGTQDGTAVDVGSDYYHNNIQYFYETFSDVSSIASSVEAWAAEAAAHATSDVEIKYQVSQNGSLASLDEQDWSSTIDLSDLSNFKGKYIWIRVKFKIGTEQTTMYSASYIGVDGANAPNVEFYNNLSAFPVPGSTDKICVAKDSNILWRWNGSAYDSISGGSGGSASQMAPASDTLPGTGGTVPAPVAGDNTKFLRGDATWAAVTSNGAGSNDTSSKIYLIGTTSQTTGSNSLQTYSHDTVYVDTDGCLRSGNAKVLTAHQDISGKANNNQVVHLTGNETVAGTKTFSSSPVFTASPIVKSTSSRYKYINFNNGSASHAYIRADSGDATNLTASQFCFVERSPKSTADGSDAGGGEYYVLPACTKGLTSTVTYNIYTSKDVIPIANGGTGATSASAARTKLELGTAAVKNVETTLGASSANIPTSAAVATYVTGKGYLTSHQSLSTCVKTTGNWTLAGTITFSGVISSTNTTAGASGAGAIKTSGGIYSAKAIYCGTTITAAGNITGAKVYNAVWNDYAECRQAYTDEPGYCVTETKNGVMAKTWERLQPGCKMISDTFGTCMGETDEAKTPIAVAGRVLAYPCRDISEYHLGDAVCSAPDGKIDIMTREEIREYPERIVGTVSEIPSYDVWYGGTKEDPQKIPVNGRIWIYVR